MLPVIPFFFWISRMLCALLSRRDPDSWQHKYLVAEKELQILRRTLNQHGLAPRLIKSDRFFFASFRSVLNRISDALTIVKPKTVMAWYHDFLKLRWTHPSGRRGRKPIAQTIKNLILAIKKSNLFFGLTKIQGELAKLDIDLGRSTIQRVLHEHRRNRDLLPWGTWRAFLKVHWNSLFACDFFTVDGALGQCWYVFFLIELKSRQIVQWGVTANPTKIFVQQQLLSFTESRSGPIHLIHDHGPELMAVDYRGYRITGHPTCILSPNLNAYAERFVRFVRRECLDHFIILSQRHLKNLLREYIGYYNHRRPHQGLGNQIPSGRPPDAQGPIRSRPVLVGLFRDYYRSA
jgi:transposase InsO family protein